MELVVGVQEVQVLGQVTVTHPNDTEFVVQETDGLSSVHLNSVDFSVFQSHQKCLKINFISIYLYFAFTFLSEIHHLK